MEIKLLSREEQERIHPQVLEMLTEADGDFVPPLSSRSSSVQQTFTGNTTQRGGVQDYFAELTRQRFAAVLEGETLVAFVSYKEDYICEHIPPETLPNIYLTTLIVRPSFRGQGVTTALYKMLFAAYADRNIFTRTWSTNGAHIRVLEKYGFSLIKTLPDHRGPGIHTVYFQK